MTRMKKGDAMVEEIDMLWEVRRCAGGCWGLGLGRLKAGWGGLGAGAAARGWRGWGC